jgi:hypothetical protein
MLSKVLAIGLLIVCGTAVQAGNPFVKQQVVLSGSHCVTPVQTFSSPVYSYSSPVVSSQYAAQSVVANDYVAANTGDDVSRALEVISRFKLQQRLLDDGLTALGYAPQGGQAYSTYSSHSAPAVNFGLAPYAQGTTQYQVESLQVSSFGNPSQTIQENLNALARLADNMNKSSATIGASVGSSVQSLSNGLTAQAAGQVEVAKINAEAAARLAIIQAASQLVEQSRSSAQFDASVQVSAVQSESTDPVVQAATVASPNMEMLKKTCFSCHSGENVKGEFTFDTEMTEEKAQRAIASVLTGTMPKNKPALSTMEKVQIVDILTSLAKNQ